MQKVAVKVKDLRVHPAQMRTMLDPEEMARLVLQVYTRGLDADRPIMVADNGDGTYRVVKGHRRWLALMLAEEARRRLGDEEVDLEALVDLVGEFCSHTEEALVCEECGTPVQTGYGSPWCPQCGEHVTARKEEVRVFDPFALAQAYEPLVEKHPDLVVEALLFEGGEKEEILALQADNFGQEEPDLLGQARSFAAAVRAGASPREIAANTGLPLSRVEAILAMSRVPEDLAKAIAAGDVPLSVAPAVARLRKKAQREGMALAILDARYGLTVERVRQAVPEMQDWSPPQVSLDPTVTPQARYEQRVAAALWAEAVKKNPVGAWYAVGYLVLGGGGYFSHRLAEVLKIEDLGEWIAEHVPEVSCENCQLRDLLADAPEFNYPRYPCQYDAEALTCERALAPGDPFYLQVPWGWGDLPGVETVNGRYGKDHVCLSPDDFRRALEAFRERQEAEAQEGGPATGSTFDETDLEVMQIRHRAEAQTVENVRQQRDMIRSFVLHHEELDGAGHPTATRCADCKYRLDGSPTKDPTVPPCTWAARRYNVLFLVRQPVKGETGPVIPLCRQFAPRKPWAEIIPAHPAPPGVPREWMLEVIRRIVREVDWEYGIRPVCEWLTGRPFRSSEDARGWFLEALEAQAADLTDAQLWTLTMWVLAEKMRLIGHGDYLLPLQGGRVVRYVDAPWPFDPEPPDAPLAEGDGDD